MLFLLAIVLGVSVGQVLFKYGANALDRGDRLWGWLSSYLVAGSIIYCACAIVWVLLLRNLALSKAYPFFSLSFAIVPILGWFFFNEPLGRLYAIGILCICVGIFLVTR
jgi:undecaprenyl phosphate-alpha-L-ara4N flippase subunit ArnF